MDLAQVGLWPGFSTPGPPPPATHTWILLFGVGWTWPRCEQLFLQVPGLEGVGTEGRGRLGLL
jgi:hypothetical protein